MLFGLKRSATRSPAGFGWFSRLPSRWSLLHHLTSVCIPLYFTLLLADSVVYSLAEPRIEQVLSDNETTSLKSAPFVYTRLRVDKYYLPLSETYLQKQPYDEKQLELKLKDREEPINYYISTKYDVDNITENELILEALDQTYRIRLLQPFAQSFDKPGDRERSSDPEKVSQEKCSRDLKYLLKKLRILEKQPPGSGTGLDPELATFFDSYSPEEAGLLMGNFIWNGNWRQCSHRRILDLKGVQRALRSNETTVHSSQIIDFSGRFCLASIRSPSWEESIKRKTKKMSQAGYLEDAIQESQYERYFRIQVGLCLPESCDSNLLFTKPDEIHTLATFKLRDTFKSYQLIDLFCLPDETSPMRKLSISAWALILVSSSWLTIVVVSTWLDYADGEKSRRIQLLFNTENELEKREKFSNTSGTLRKLLVSMSLIESYKTLVKIRRQKKQTSKASKENGNIKEEEGSEPAASDLVFLNAIKVLIMPSIVFGHCGMLTMQANTIPLDYNALPPLVYHLLVGSTFYVDYYFAITGFLTTYCSFASRAVFRLKPGQWLYSIVHRYWRLMPGYLLLFWFSRSLFKHTGSGALWDYGTSNTSTRAVCQRESWLTPLTLTSNLHPLYEECIMPTWYISNDMQYYLITPPILILLASSPSLGWLAICVAMLANILLRAHRFYTDPMVNPLALLRSRYDVIVRNQRDISDTYLLPHYRIGAYLFGLLGGHYAYMVRSGRWRSPLTGSGARARRIRTLMLLVGLALCILMNLASAILDTILPTALDRYMRELATFLFSLDHLFGSFGPMLIMMALTLNAWPRLRELMELPVWTYFSRINYFVFLFQIELIAWYVNSADLRPGSTGVSILQLFTFVMPQLYLMSIAATLLLANPLARLESEFVGALFAHKSSSSHRQPKVDASQVVTCTDHSGATCGSSSQSHPLSSIGQQQQQQQQQTLTTITATG